MIPHRKERMESLLKREIAGILLQKVQDPRIKGIHVVSVKISADFSAAKVMYSTLVEGAPIDEIQAGLDSAKAFIRGEVGKVVQIKKIPEIYFVFDRSIQEGDRVLAILKQLNLPSEDDEF